VSDVPAYTCDLFPTVLAAAGVAVPPNSRPLDGVNVLPVLDGRMRERPRPIVFHFDDFKRKARKGPFGSNGFAVVEGRFKWMTDLNGENGRLFDVVTDPAEKTDRAAERQDVAARLEAVRVKWWTEVQAEPAFRPADAPAPARRAKRQAAR
jgi:arylsulfatase A-like enzyme